MNARKQVPSGPDTYPDLHNARERLCRAQTYIESKSHRQLLQEAMDNIDRVGVFLHPSRWSRHDNPPMPESEPDDDGNYDSDHADLPQCDFWGQNGDGVDERCLRRRGHPGDHMGMGSE